MINDIPHGLDGVEMSLFADDSAIYTGHRNHSKLQNKIQLSLNSFDAWCNKNGFKISINKTIGVLFTKKHRIPNTSVKVGNERIKIKLRNQLSSLEWSLIIGYHGNHI